MSRDSSKITLDIDFSNSFASPSEAISYLEQAISISEEHTGEGTEGDYLTYNRVGYQCSCQGYFENETNYFRITSANYTFAFLTTADQESDVTSKLDSVYSYLSLDNKTDVAKINAIYGYITDNVSYDYVNLNSACSTINNH